QTTEMTIRARFTEISKFTSAHVLSKPTEFAGLNWRIRLYKKDDHLSFFVKAYKNAATWSCSAIVDYQLISQKDENIIHHISSKMTDVYRKEGYPCWGQNKFISFKDLFDDKKGYVKDDSIIVAAVIKAFPNAQ
ncbi:hypothetical protein PENTCL1PPCAC_21246, partial [Pristionchus entomophagus]